MSESIRLRDVEIQVDDGEDGIFVKGRGGVRCITYEELVELAESDNPVTIR